MTAAEARVKAHNVKLEASKGQYEKIEKIIASAAAAGRYEVTYYDKLEQGVRLRLQRELYTVKDVVTGVNESGVEITW